MPNSTTREATELGKYSRSTGELSAMAHLKSDAPQAAFEALSQGQQMESAATQLAVNRTVRGDQNDLAAQHEGETIKGIFPDSKLFVGTEASRDNLLIFAPGADALHLATHGISDSADSLNNYLALAGNGRLTQEEIFNLDLGDTTLVTLSACNTALSDSTEYEFVASIAEAFWIAGSRSVVASLWAVDDDSTEKLMTGFYRGMKEQGLGKAEALRRAQLAVRSQPRFEHPYYWSGFMLFGDYR